MKLVVHRRRRNHRRRRRQGPGRDRPHRGRRRRDGREPPVVDQARRPAVGDGAGRDPADAGRERPPGEDPGPGRRRVQDGPRRGRGGASRGRRVLLRHRGAARRGLHHGPDLPPRHLSGGHRQPAAGAAGEVHRHPGDGRQLPAVRGRGGAADPGLARAPLAGRGRSAGSTSCRPRTTGQRRADALDLGPLLADPGEGPRRFEAPVALQKVRSDLGDRVAAEALPALREGQVLGLSFAIGNGDRSVGARLGTDLAREFGDRRPPGRVRVSFEGQAGQSFGAFLSDGVEFHLTGRGQRLRRQGHGRRPDRRSSRRRTTPGTPTWSGNTVLYGATGGQLFCAGRAGERFAVRNSGAVAVDRGRRRPRRAST